MKSIIMLAAMLAALAIGAPDVQAGDGQRDRNRDGSCQQEGCDGTCPVDRDCTGDADGRQRADRSRGGRSKSKAKRKRQRKGKGAGKGNGQGKRKRARRGGDGTRSGNGTGDGSCGALDDVENDGTQTVSDDYLARLQSALENELYARDYYVAADAALNGLPVFANLSRAEQHHADAVANMIRIVGGSAVLVQPVDVVVPATAEAAAAQCTAIELFVIDVYAGLIEDCTDDRILAALEAIQAANYRHLAAVEQ